jgi:hypothetical protein
MSRLWFQKAFLNSVKTAGRAKGIGSRAFAKFPVTHRLRRRLAVASTAREVSPLRADMQRLGRAGPLLARAGPTTIGRCRVGSVPPAGRIRANEFRVTAGC